MEPEGRIWRRLREDRAGLAGLAVVSLFLVLAAAAWLGLVGQDWSIAAGGRWEPPSPQHWFGTNILGQDIFQRAVYSVRTAFEVGLVVAVLSTLLGALLGALAGWYSHGWPDGAILWLMGVLDSIPFYLFVAAVAYALQGQPWAMHVAMIATFWTGTGRLGDVRATDRIRGAGLRDGGLEADVDPVLVELGDDRLGSIDPLLLRPIAGGLDPLKVDPVAADVEILRVLVHA